MLALIFYNRGYITAAVAIFLLFLAWRRGGQPEIAAAAALVGMMLSQYAYNLLDTAGMTIWHVSDYWDVEPAFVLIDGGCFLALSLIAIRANRIYPLWLAGFQLLALLGHAPRTLGPDIHPVAYYSFIYGPWYLELASLSIGIVAQIRRRRSPRYAAGTRSWRRSR